MKNLKDYLTESKKTWNFKVKVAGDLPEKFESTLKNILAKWDVTIGEKTTTPIQKLPIDFPQLENREVHIFEITANYPVTPPEIMQEIHEAALINPECFVVRIAGEPTEMYQEPAPEGYIVKLESELENPYGDVAQDMVGEKRILSLFKDLTSYKNTKLDTEMNKPYKSDSVDAPLGNHKLPDLRGKKK